MNKAHGKKYVVIILVLVFVLLPLVSFAGKSNPAEEEAVESTQPEAMEQEAAKYVFLFIGDGMGMPQINSAERYLAALEGEDYGARLLSFSRFPAQGLTTTYANDRFITGSAASATAMATGYKTNIGVISMDPAKTRNYKTIAEMAKEEGMKVGIISSVSIDHATPAAFYAHQPSRSNYYEISVQLAESGFDFFGGGGIKSPTGKKKDQPSSIERAKKNGYTVVDNRSDFMALSPGVGKVLAYNAILDGSKALPYEMDRDMSDLSLAEYTRKAVELLDNPNGFFMMIEGGKIDWACHANDAAASVKDTFAFDEAVQVAVNFMDRHPDETLIVVTGDHECGGMTLGFAGQGYETNFMLLANQKKSATDFFAGELVSQYKKSMTARDFDKAMEAVEEYFGLVYLSASEKSALESRAEAGDKDAAMRLALSLSDYELKQIRDAYNRSLQGEEERADDESTYLLYGGYDPFAVTLSHILNQKAGIGWTSYKHTGVPVPTFAAGVGAEIFNGYYDNTDIAKKMMEIMKLNMVLASAQ